MNTRKMKGMSWTLYLLKLIPTAFSMQEFQPSDTLDFVQLLESARKNRISLPLLETVNRVELKDKFEAEVKKYEDMLVSVSKVSELLTQNGIKHAVFKTVRPYRCATVDIDIIIFGTPQDHARSYLTLQRNGFELVVHGPKSTTMMDTQTNIGIDLYREIAVSNIDYIDKDKLAAHVEIVTLPNGRNIANLEPEADLVCIIAHSIIKEQMYVLSEYYTFLQYLRKLNIASFINLVRQNHLTNAVRTHACITALLHKTAHGNLPSLLDRMLKDLGEENLETGRIAQKNYETPIKYHTVTVARSLLEIARTPKTRKSFAEQITKMADPDFSKTFLKALLQHATRQTY